MRGFANRFYSSTVRSCLAAGLLGSAMFAAPGTAHADADKRLALVIGNGNYKVAPKLGNPPNDARAIAETLRKLGFEVVDGYDLDSSQMRRKVSDFSLALGEAKSAVVYYAGHGVSVDGEDYLLPVDIDLKGPGDLDVSAIDMSVVLKQMKREDPDGANIVLLDACRDNPFADALQHKTRAAVGPRGLSRIEGELARGTLIAFATDPNSTAQDGVQGGHSPFAEALLNHLQDPGVPIDTVMTRVRTEVFEKTKHTQRPWVNTSLIGEFSFNPQTASLEAAPPAAAPVAIAVAPTSPAHDDAVANLVEHSLWESAEHSNTREDFQAYLDKYPNGTFAEMAKNRIAALNSASTGTRTIEAAPPTGPAGPSEKDLRAEVGTYDTEKSLHLQDSDRKEIQKRLQVLLYYNGPIDGSFNEATRRAIGEWQKKRQVAPTGNLGPLEVAALREESDEMYQRYLASLPPDQPDAQPASPQATAPSAQTPATGYHQNHYYQPRYHAYHAYHPYHYYGGGGYRGGGSIFGIFGF